MQSRPSIQFDPCQLTSPATNQ